VIIKNDYHFFYLKINFSYNLVCYEVNNVKSFKIATNKESLNVFNRLGKWFWKKPLIQNKYKTSKKSNNVRELCKMKKILNSYCNVFSHFIFWFSFGNELHFRCEAQLI